MLPFNEVGLMYVDVLAALHQCCFEKAWSKETFSSLLMLPTTRGFVNQDGFILFSVCADEAEILTLGVAPDARQKGVGMALLNHSIAYLKKLGVRDFFLDVNVQNYAALKLYEKAGFEVVGLRKNYYTQGAQKSDALVLKKKI